MDPDGEFLGIAIAIGAIIGAYIGGSAAEGWEMNPTKWDWDGDTWKGVGLGAVFGAAGGAGFYYAAPALAQTSFFANFGVSGTIGAFTVSGGVFGGAIGYTSGFSGGMIYSDGDWNYSHQSGIFGAKVGATIGAVVGAIGGKIQSYVPPKNSKSLKLPGKQATHSQFINLTEEEATGWLADMSKMKGMEMMMYSTDYGYFYERTYGYQNWSISNYDNRLNSNSFSLGFSLYSMDYYPNVIMKVSNTIGSCRGYSLFYPENSPSVLLNYGLYNSTNVYKAYHTHPNNTGLSYGFDTNTALYNRIPFFAVGWDKFIRTWNIINEATITRDQ